MGFTMNNFDDRPWIGVDLGGGSSAGDMIAAVIDKKTVIEHGHKLASDVPPFHDHDIHCFAFRRDDNGKPYCTALRDIYCLIDGVCSFYAPPEQAEAAERAAYDRAYGGT